MSWGRLQEKLESTDKLSTSEPNSVELGIYPVTLPDVAMVTREPEMSMMMRSVAVFAHLMADPG